MRAECARSTAPAPPPTASRPGRWLPWLAWLAATAAGCLPPPTPERPALAPPRRRPADQLVVAQAAEPQSFDPALCNDSVGSEMAINLFAGLVELDPATQLPVPDLAERWTLSADGRTYTFHLRPSAWSDGVPVTADDFAFSVRRVLEPRTGCRFASMLDVIDGAEAYRRAQTPSTSGTSAAGAPEAGLCPGAEAGPPLGVRALDPRTLEVRLVRPTPYFLQLAAHTILRPVPRHVLTRLERAGAPADAWIRPEHLVSSGPFRLTARRFKRDYTLERNAHYWGATQVALRRVQVLVLEDGATAVNLYRTGELDWTGSSSSMPAAYGATLAGYSDFRREAQLNTAFLWLNVERPQLADVRVREALSLAIDRVALTQHVLRGGQLPWADLVPPGLPGYRPVGRPLYDPARARALLAAAGYGPGRPLQGLTLVHNTGEGLRQLAEAVQAMWQATLGIQVALQSQEWNVYLATLQQQAFDIARLGWVGDYLDPASFLTDVLGQAAGNNLSGWHSASFEALLQRAAATPEPQARMALLHDAEAQALAAVPLVPLYVGTQAQLVHPQLRGLLPSPQGHHPLKALHIAPQGAE